MSNFGNIDFESIISDNILSAPFTNYIDRMAERDGLNSKDYRRKAAAIGGSILMGGFIGATIGGPLGFIVGLMGYAAGMAVRFDDEEKDNELLEAAIRAAKRIKQTVPEEIVDEIYDDLMEHINKYDTDKYSNKKCLEMFYRIMANVEPKVANLWLVYLKTEI